MIKLYDTKSKQVVNFEPISPINRFIIRVWCHSLRSLSYWVHARAYVVFDLLKRVLSHADTVNHIQNFTDIDDKIIDRSNQLGIPWQTLTTQFIDAYFDDMNQLNILPANAYPKATETISQMIALIQTLIDSNSAYEVNGSVYFRVESCADYGCLSKKY